MGKVFISVVVAAGLLGCSPEPASTVKKLDTNRKASGFLGDYSQLKPRSDLDSDLATYINPDKTKDLHRYIAIIVDPVQVYLKTDADESLIPTTSTEAAAAYFRGSLIRAVADAFPIVQQAGPLTLRLRSAIVGVDVGSEVDKSAIPEGVATALPRAMNIGEVGIEVELVDSETGERIAAAVDKAKLGEGAEVGADNFSRVERYHAAMDAFDGWADRIREFLDQAHERNDEDAQRADKAYVPY
jgi:hypothetical protein